MKCGGTTRRRTVVRCGDIARRSGVRCGDVT